MSRPGSRAAWIELSAATSLLASYIWIWQGTFEGDFLLCLALFLGLTIWGHRRRGESARDLGFRLDNLRASARLVFSYVLPLLILLVGSGLVLDLHRELPVDRLGMRIALMPLFGLAQQYGLLGFYYRRFREALGGSWTATLAAAVVFAGLHAPNVPVMVMTLALSVGACWLYRKVPNLWVMGLAHGLLSLTVAMFLAKLLVSGLKVGPRALR